jgi:hypothetical protein
MTGNWGSYIQGQGWEEIDKAGSALSQYLHEPVHYPAWNKRLFECKCCVIFPVWMIEAAMKTGDYRMIQEKHKLGPDIKEE